MFPFSKEKNDDFDTDKLELLNLLQELQQVFTDRSDPHRILASQHIQDCLREVQAAQNHLTLALTLKWLDRELGAMIYDKQLHLSSQEQELWTAIKDLDSRHSNVGHGTGLGL